MIILYQKVLATSVLKDHLGSSDGHVLLPYPGPHIEPMTKTVGARRVLSEPPVYSFTE